MYPSYLESYNSGELQKRIREVFAMLKSCSLCPRKCRVNRLKNELGYCKTGLLPQVYSFAAHQGEEPPISGIHGSGTIFFSHCNMSCLYCQNYEFSQLGKRREVSFKELAKFMLHLQAIGCHNINLVSPTHVMPQILKSLSLAIALGLKIPLVYNTGGYEDAEILKLLGGIVDIYLPDMRYGDSKMAKKYSDAPDYPKYNQAAIKEMHRQAGIAKIGQDGMIKKGLIIRHLVLPNRISGTDKIMEFLSREVSSETSISLMSQYLPCHKATTTPELARRITYEEYEEAKDLMQQHGLHNGWSQEAYGLERFAGTNIKPSFKENDGP